MTKGKMTKGKITAIPSKFTERVFKYYLSRLLSLRKTSQIRNTNTKQNIIYIKSSFNCYNFGGKFSIRAGWLFRLINLL